jgi:hypothetical protein
MLYKLVAWDSLHDIYNAKLPPRNWGFATVVSSPDVSKLQGISANRSLRLLLTTITQCGGKGALAIPSLTIEQ